MKCLILYSSMTGNTKKLAEAIYNQLDGLVPIHTVKDTVNIDAYDTLCLGYWVKKGGCDKVTKKVWEKIHGKKILLFGTMAADINSPLGQSQMERIEKVLPADNEILGHFTCQGALSPETLQQYHEKLAQEPDNHSIKEQLANAPQCESHPDKMDLLEVMRFIHYTIGH